MTVPLADHVDTLVDFCAVRDPVEPDGAPAHDLHREAHAALVATGRFGPRPADPQWAG